MRIPDVSQDEATATVRRGVELGVNYIETAPGYGDSEVKIGKAIKGIRDKVYLSTKVHPNDAPDTAGIYRAIEKSMKRLDVEHLDFYHMWYICNKADWKGVMKRGGELDGAKKAREEGLIDHIGITTHAPVPLVKEMVASGEFELVTISYNMAQREYEEIVDFAGERKVGVVIMNPLAGGLLAKAPKGTSGARTGAARRPRAHIMAALGFLLANPNVTTAICGAKSAEEMEEDCAAGEFLPREFLPRDFLPGGTAAAGRREDFGKLGGKFCTTCAYCMPCEAGVNISHAMLNWNYWKLYDIDFTQWNKAARKKLMETVAFEKCIECGACESECPNSLPIMKRLKKLMELLEAAGK
jgi:predicted aldo/keto reductase-like oxidoreductase